MTFHSEVVGSLLRPPYLVEARKQFEAGSMSAADFKAVEDRAVNEAIALQEAAGIDVITDGEMRRYALYGHLIDAPQYAALLDPQMREGYRQRGSDPDKIIDQCIAMDNAIIDGHPGITFGIHICRGNNQSKFYASGDYEPISRIFTQTHFSRFLLEYDDTRSGGFEPLRHVPADRFVVLGLVTTKKPRLESADELRRRIEEASRYIPLERLALSPQCGFASTLEGHRTSPEVQ